MTHYLRALMARLGGSFGDRRADRDLDGEIETHLRLLTERYVRRGMTEEEAARAARRQFGNVTLLKEAHREMRGIRFIETLFQDVRYGLWMMRRNPGFTLVAVLTLALGIGANTAIFSVVNPLVFNPLPYRDPQQLVWITYVFRGNEVIGLQDYLTWKAQSKTFDHLAAFDGGGNHIRASASLFQTLGVAPRLGRAFTPEDERPGGAPVMILSHDFWQRRFGGDPSIVGRSVPFGRGNHLIIGVMPPGFRFLAEKRTGGNVDIWVLDPMYSQRELKEGENTILENVIGRMKPGVSIEQAQSELDLIFRRYAQTHRPNLPPDIHLRVTPLAGRLVGHLRRGLLTLFGSVGMVLLIACANVANLLLARANTRQKEMAIRAAIGAGRGRLIRQMLTESLLLSLIGGAAGLLLAWWGVKTLVAMTPDNMAQLRVCRIDGSVLGFSFLATLLTSVAAGLIPALHASRADLNESLKDAARGAAFFFRSRTRRVSPALVIGELALTLVMLIGAGLLIKSFLVLRSVDLGYDPKNLLTMVIQPDRYKYLPGSEQLKNFNQELLRRINALPGVQGAATGNPLPMVDTGIRPRSKLTVVGRPPEPESNKPPVESFDVSAEYFRLMGMKLRAGRGFTEQEDRNATPIIVNETLVRQYFAGENPIGKRIQRIGDKEPVLTVVGVVADVKRYGIEAESLPEIYSYLASPHFPIFYLAVRAVGDPLKLAPAVRQQVREIDASPSTTINLVTTMEQYIDQRIAPRRFQMALFGLFAALALIIATVGIYGVISYAVSQRTHEIGIRMALGAQVRDVLRMVIWRGMILILAGVALGLITALGLTRLIKNLLFGVSATDPVTFAAIAILLAGVALLACYVPARRATKVDPLQAIRHE